jgi:hypothetical protein
MGYIKKSIIKTTLMIKNRIQEIKNINFKHLLYRLIIAQQDKRMITQIKKQIGSMMQF